MNIRLMRVAVLTASFAVAPLASAQNLDSLMGGGGGSLLGSLTSGSFSFDSIENVAGILGYCQEKGYTEGAADTVKDKLLGKIGGQQEASQNDDYQQGLQGLLQGEGGKTFDLTALKEMVGKKACSTVADKAASSFLGG